jgi:hypothetical protein
MSEAQILANYERRRLVHHDCSVEREPDCVRVEWIPVTENDISTQIKRVIHTVTRDRPVLREHPHVRSVASAVWSDQRLIHLRYNFPTRCFKSDCGIHVVGLIAFFDGQRRGQIA